MKVNSDLKLVFPVKYADEPDETGKAIPLVWAYHIPIDRDIFELNFELISKTYVKLFGNKSDYSVGIALKIAKLTLAKIGKEEAASLGVKLNPADALFGELMRLTTILAPTSAGYSEIPVPTAISTKVIDDEEWSEALSALIFFTCPYALAARAEKIDTAQSFASMLQGSTTSLTPSEWLASLPKSTPAETSPPPAEESAPVSLLPS